MSGQLFWGEHTSRRRNTQKEWEWAWPRPTQWPPRLWEGTTRSAAAKTRNKGFSQNNHSASLHSHGSTEVSLWVSLSLCRKHSPRVPTHGKFLNSRAISDLISRQNKTDYSFSFFFDIQSFILKQEHFSVHQLPLTLPWENLKIHLTAHRLCCL